MKNWHLVPSAGEVLGNNSTAYEKNAFHNEDYTSIFNEDGLIKPIIYNSYKNRYIVLSSILERISSCIFISEIDTGKILFANAAYKRTFANDSVNKNCASIIENCSVNDKQTLLTSVWARGTGYSEIYLEKFGQYFAVDAAYIAWPDGKEVRMVEVRTLLLQESHKKDIEKMAYIDHLTKLPNRYRCDMDLEKAVHDAKTKQQMGFVIFLDLDDFKFINDSYGHDYGDAVLVEFARYLSEDLEWVDKVYRFGGDEFVLLMTNRKEDDLIKVVDSILSRATRPWNTGDKQFYSTVSIGIVRYPDETSTAKEIIKNADIAMYQVKNTGKNNYFIYSDDLENDSIRRVEMERLIRAAIKNDFEGFEVYYQPIFDLESQNILGAEALVRWFDESGKMIMPDQFIALSEYLGLIVPIGNFVLREAAEFCKKINDNGFPKFNISVNVSIRQFQQRNFVKTIDEILEKTGIDYSNVILEVTEGMAAANLQRMCSILDEVREKGVRFAMDDFGTGYSSLSNLRQLSIDIIKIDRTFIRDITIDPYSDSFIRMITDLGHSINKEICIEGVETEEQLAYCMETGVNMIQGYYFSRPLTKEKMQEMIDESKNTMDDYITAELA